MIYIIYFSKYLIEYVSEIKFAYNTSIALLLVFREKQNHNAIETDRI